MSELKINISRAVAHTKICVWGAVFLLGFLAFPFFPLRLLDILYVCIAYFLVRYHHKLLEGFSEAYIIADENSIIVPLFFIRRYSIFPSPFGITEKEPLVSLQRKDNCLIVPFNVIDFWSVGRGEDTYDLEIRIAVNGISRTIYLPLVLCTGDEAKKLVQHFETYLPKVSALAKGNALQKFFYVQARIPTRYYAYAFIILVLWIIIPEVMDWMSMTKEIYTEMKANSHIKD